MCKVCENEISPHMILENCSKLVEIPVIRGLKSLRCDDCPNLIRIPDIQGLERLDVYDCAALSVIPCIKGLKKLYIWNCPSLSILPSIKGLKVLQCKSLKNLIEIPMIEELKTLICEDLPKIAKIPDIHGLEKLWCWNCPGVKEIPFIEGLEDNIHIYGCRNLIKIPYPETKYVPYYCPWAHHIYNFGYQKNINILKFLQKWLRRMMVRKKLIRLIPRLMPLYYHPLAKGGYFHKKDMSEFLNLLD